MKTNELTLLRTRINRLEYLRARVNRLELFMEKKFGAIAPLKRPKDPIAVIKRIVSDICRVPGAKLSAQRRGKNEFSLPRKLAMHFSLQCDAGTLQHIAQQFGRTDHATVIYANRTVKDLVQTDSNFRRKYNKCRMRIQKELGIVVEHVEARPKG